jgi:LmbE family N-acetylglucosaminyl deacetylase
MKDYYQQIFSNKTKVLVVFAHPDDAEIYCGGTIARLIKDGKRVRVVKMSSGNKGSRQEKVTEAELKKTRETEDSKAMSELGIKPEDSLYLNFGDGEIDNSLGTIGILVEQIRTFQPDIIITHNPEDIIIRFDKDVNWVNHRDHRNTGMSVVDASYPYSRDILFFPEQLTKSGVQPHTVTEYLFVDSYNHQDEISIDVTDTHEIRTKAIACHSSQYSNEDAQESTDFFTKLDDTDKRWERFRYVVAD